MTVCFFFASAPFVSAQVLFNKISFSIGLGGGLGLESANNATNTINTEMVIDMPYYYHNKNKYYDLPLDAFISFDLTYIEASIGFWWGGRTINSDREGTWTLGIPGNTDRNIENGGLIGGWSWIVFLKTPPLGRMHWFPMLGMESRILSWVNAGDDVDASLFIDNSQTWNNIWYKAGFGFDREITKKVFARMEFLLGFRGDNQYEKNLGKIHNSGVDGVPVSISWKFIFFYNL